MAAPVPRPARHSQPFPVLAALACLAGALWLRRAASAPRAAPPPAPAHAPAAPAHWLELRTVLGSRAGQGHVAAGFPPLLPSGRRRRYNTLRNFPGSQSDMCLPRTYTGPGSRGPAGGERRPGWCGRRKRGGSSAGKGEPAGRPDPTPGVFALMQWEAHEGITG